MALSGAERQKRYLQRLMANRDGATVPLIEHEAAVAALKVRVKAFLAERDGLMEWAQKAYARGAEAVDAGLPDHLDAAAVRTEAMRQLHRLQPLTLRDLIDLAEQAGAARYRHLLARIAKEMDAAE